MAVLEKKITEGTGGSVKAKYTPRYRITKINENQKTAELVHMDTNKKRLSHLLYLKKDSSAGQGIIPLKNQAVDLIRKATMKRERRLRAQTSTNAD